MNQADNPVTIWYLESRSAAELKPATDPGGVDIREAKTKQFQFNRFLYQLVGADWEWNDKLEWTDEQWQGYAEADNLRCWVVWCEGAPAGYFELQMQSGKSVEVSYFGVARKFLGRGIGGHLLTEAIKAAWGWGASRVWLHTCSLDHPYALANYQARGLTVYKTEQEPG